MAQEAINILSGLGRLVRGSLTARQTHDYDNNPYEEGKGPFELGFAVPKTDPKAGEILTKVYQHASAAYVANAGILQRMKIEWESGFSAGTFRFKIRDGDKPNQEGRVNENTVGHWVINLQSYIPFKCTYIQGYGLPKFKDANGRDIEPNTEIHPSLIKIGDFVHMNIGTKANEKTDHTAGMFMNINAVILAAHGPAITGGIDLKSATEGLVIGALPPGASVAPVAGMPSAAPAGNVAPVAAASSLPAPVPAVSTPAALPTASPTNVVPHETFLAGPGGAPAGVVGMPGMPGA